MHVACEGLSDLANGPNKPTATIIGEYSASFHHGTLILTMVIARIDPSSSSTSSWISWYKVLYSPMIVAVG